MTRHHNYDHHYDLPERRPHEVGETMAGMALAGGAVLFSVALFCGCVWLMVNAVTFAFYGLANAW